MILRERLAELLYRQSWNSVPEASLPKDSPWPREKYLEQADAIIAFFVEAIRSLEFKTPKHFQKKNIGTFNTDDVHGCIDKPSMKNLIVYDRPD